MPLEACMLVYAILIRRLRGVWDDVDESLRV